MTSSPLVLRGLRGATTCTENSTEAIEAAVSALMDALVDRNDLSPDQLVSVTFSVTADLDACFRLPSPGGGPAGTRWPCWIASK